MQLVRNKNVVLLVIIIVLGGMLRLTNLNWDSSLAFHPDERNIAWAVTRIHFFDQMNPKFFAYGGLPIYLYRAIAEVVALITKDVNWLAEWGKIAVLGRYVSATLSTISLYLSYRVGALFFSPAVGILSALLLAFSPWAIREAHFATTETSLVFLLLVLLLLSYDYKKNPTRKTAIKIGWVLGLAIGAKTTSILFSLIPLSAIVLALFQKTAVQKIHRFTTFVINGFICLVIAETVFLLVSPYALLDWTHFKESMQYETGVALGNLAVPYTLQFLHTTPYLYQLKTMLWQAGPVAIVGVMGLLVLILSSFQALLRKKFSPSSIVLCIFLIFPLIYGVWSGSWYAKFARYTLPFLPFATIAAAWLIIVIYSRRKKDRFSDLLLSCFLAFLLVLHILWGLANWTIYLRPQTRVEASRWMYRNIPKDAVIFTEHWNDGLPVDVPGEPHPGYTRDTLTVYEPDNTTKLEYYLDKLTQADFIILSTRRIWATMPHLTEKYPLTSVFYEKLLNGSLGYNEAASFTAYPSLLGITINDDASEESVQVFDHPTVRIFQNTEKLSKIELRKRLNREVDSEE